MKVAAIYDIHANLPALEAVLRDVRKAGVDRVVCGGDVVPGPMPRETIARLLELDLPVDFIQGNGDREVLAQLEGAETDWYRSAAQPWREPVRWTAQQLQLEHKQLLSGWAKTKTLSLTIDGLGEVLFCHATPRSDTEVFTRLTAEYRLRPVFAGLSASVVICGHTHMQFDRMVGGIRVVNTGSVGMPFGEPGAYWLSLGPTVQLRCTTYDLAQAARRIRDTEYPQAEDFATHNVVQPPLEKQTLDVFARVELK
jgi:putative phosphoesterase